MRRLSNCTYCGKKLVANPNVCIQGLESVGTMPCCFADCFTCEEHVFACSECRDILLTDRLELDILQGEEQSLVQRLAEVRGRERTLSAYLRR